MCMSFVCSHVEKVLCRCQVKVDSMLGEVESKVHVYCMSPEMMAGS
jgi:hypothetical protein